MECQKCQILQAELAAIRKAVQPLICLVNPEGIACASPIKSSTPSKSSPKDSGEEGHASFEPGAGQMWAELDVSIEKALKEENSSTKRTLDYERVPKGETQVNKKRKEESGPAGDIEKWFNDRGLKPILNLKQVREQIRLEEAAKAAADKAVADMKSSESSYDRVPRDECHHNMKKARCNRCDRYWNVVEGDWIQCSKHVASEPNTQPGFWDPSWSSQK